MRTMNHLGHYITPTRQVYSQCVMAVVETILTQKGPLRRILHVVYNTARGTPDLTTRHGSTADQEIYTYRQVSLHILSGQHLVTDAPASCPRERKPGVNDAWWVVL